MYIFKLRVYLLQLSSCKAVCSKIMLLLREQASTFLRNAIEMAVRVLRLISMADSRTERLRVLLPASIRPSCIAHMYLIHLIQA